MATYHFDPLWMAHVIVIGIYLLGVWFAANAALVIARTVAVKLPLRTDEDGFTVDLCWWDYSPKLRSHSGIGTKVAKIMVNSLWLLLGIGCWLAAMMGSLRNDDKLLGWTLGELPAYLLHGGVILGLCTFAAVHGWRTAYKYDMPPFQRLAHALWRYVDVRNPGLRPSWIEDEVDVYKLELSTSGRTVLMGRNGDKMCWFELEVPGMGTLRLAPTTKLSRDDTYAINRILSQDV